MFFERRCPMCGVDHRHVCSNCLDRLASPPGRRIPGIDRTVALLAYDHQSSRLVLAAKNGGRRDLLRWSGGHLARAVVASCPVTLDLVTWVPAHPAQRRQRGYDQGEILARSVARHLGLRCRSTLRRTSGDSQKNLGRSERLDGPRVRARRRLHGSILLVDDVVTSGASLHRCAEVLAGAGAASVDAAVLAACDSDWRDR